MFKWLQLSLFGPKEEAPEPARTVKATRPVPPKSGLKTRSQIPTSGLSGTFENRWKSLNPKEDIEITLVPRLRQGWRLEWKRGEGGRLRVPAAMAHAPDEILGAMAAWARLVMTSRGKVRSAAARPARQALEKSLHAWIDQHAALDPRSRTLSRARAERRLDRLQPQGKHHDLQAIFDAIHREYFTGPGKEGEGEEVGRAKITWSRRWGGLSTQTWAKDAEGQRYPLITIGRGYDSPLASAEMVGGVVYHECLHIAVPPQEVTETSSNRGRRVVHGREFRRREREYRHYEEWRKWHARVLPGIVRRGAQRP